MSAKFTTIIVDRPQPDIGRITLNRPEYLNAYNHTLTEEVSQAVDQYMKDDALRCLVITGAGRGFCSGGDISRSEAAESRALRYGKRSAAGWRCATASIASSWRCSAATSRWWR